MNTGRNYVKPNIPIQASKPKTAMPIPNTDFQAFTNFGLIRNGNGFSLPDPIQELISRVNHGGNNCSAFTSFENFIAWLFSNISKNHSIEKTENWKFKLSPQFKQALIAYTTKEHPKESPRSFIDGIREQYPKARKFFPMLSFSLYFMDIDDNSKLDAKRSEQAASVKAPLALYHIEAWEKAKSQNKRNLYQLLARLNSLRNVS